MCLLQRLVKHPLLVVLHRFLVVLVLRAASRVADSLLNELRELLLMLGGGLIVEANGGGVSA